MMFEAEKSDMGTSSCEACEQYCCCDGGGGVGGAKGRDQGEHTNSHTRDGHSAAVACHRD